MRKFITIAAMLITAAALTAPTSLASEQFEPLPVEVVHDTELMEIRRIYEMQTSIDPSRIPREDFTRGDIIYTLTDILREVVIGDEVMTITETLTVESSTNDISSVMNQLPATKEILTEDGFFGTLHLDISSINSEISGRGSRTRSVSVTRRYPNLSSADLQHIPKSVTEGGVTYTLSDVRWQTDNTMNVDDYAIGDRYTAVATYSGTITSSYIKGYTITADYTGDITRSGVSIVRYTAIFSGSLPSDPESEPESDPEPEPEPDPPYTADEAEESEPAKPSGFNWATVIVPLILLTVASAGGFAYIYIKYRKEQMKNSEEIIDYDYVDPYGSDDSDDSGDGDDYGERP